MEPREMAEIKKEIEQLWEEIMQMREVNGGCRDSPQKTKAIQLMHSLAREDEEGERYFFWKRTEIRWRLAEMDYREKKYDSALLHVIKGFHLCEKGGDANLFIGLLITERKIKKSLGVLV